MLTKGEEAMAEKDMLTIAKLAQAWNVSEKLVKEAVEKSGIEPDATRGKCRFYGPAAAEKIRKAIKK